MPTISAAPSRYRQYDRDDEYVCTLSAPVYNSYNAGNYASFKSHNASSYAYNSYNTQASSYYAQGSALNNVRDEDLRSISRIQMDRA